jgi:hypothetical protein
LTLATPGKIGTLSGKSEKPGTGAIYWINRDGSELLPSGIRSRPDFRPFPVANDEHFLTVCRYVERNPLRANLVDRAENWRWSSLWHRVNTGSFAGLADWPIVLCGNWVKHVNEPHTEAELAALNASVRRGIPFGRPQWQRATADRLGIQLTPRTRGRRALLRQVAAE